MLYIFVVSTVVGVGVHEFFRRNPSLFWLFLGLIPLSMIPFWLKSTNIELFFLVKFSVVLIATCYINWLRCNRLTVKNIHYHIFYVLYLLNFMVPIWKMVSLGTIPSYLNAAAGVLLISIYPRIQSLSMDPKRLHDFLWDVSYAWICAYTIWDWNFIAIVYPQSGFIQACVLFTPLLISFFNRKLWLQARAYLLSLSLVIGMTFSDYLSVGWTEDRVSEQTTLVLAVFLLSWMILYSAFKYVKEANTLWLGSQESTQTSWWR
jgi:hypothetical protein